MDRSRGPYLERGPRAVARRRCWTPGRAENDDDDDDDDGQPGIERRHVRSVL